MSEVRALAEWAAKMQRPGNTALALAQDALVDIGGCMIAGSVEAPTSALLRMARQFGNGSALVMGCADRLQAPWAALASGTAAHALDFDDNFAPAVTHATAVLAPALFALADEEDVSGATILEAYIVGLELQARIGGLMNPTHYERGWHATSTVGVIGAAGACAKLLGLNSEQTLAAMSIAFSMAAGSKKQFGSMMKPIHAGLAAKNAVLASLMASAGITGDSEPLSGTWGFPDLYHGEPDREAASALALKGLGSSLAIEVHGLMAKRYPCCGAAHRTLDGVAELRSQHDFDLDAVDYVEAFIPKFARANLRFDRPENEMQARFSLTYCAARVLQAGRLTLADMTSERVRDAELRPWLDRIRTHVRPGSVCDELGEGASPVVTRVVLKNGKAHEVGIVAPRGTKSAPLTVDEQREKFIDCCRWAGKSTSAELLFEMTRSLGQATSFRQFSHSFAQALHR